MTGNNRYLNLNEKMKDTIQEKYGYEAAERAAIYEYEAGMTRAQAEYKVRVDIDSKRDDG